MKRLLSIAAGVHTEISPQEMVSVAAASGWPACGIWFDGKTWNEATTRDVKQRLDDSGVIALDMEPVIPSEDGDDYAERLVEAAAHIGARNILFTSRLQDIVRTTQRYAEVCDMAVIHGITVVCEFLPIFPLSCLQMAHDIVVTSGVSNGGILIDNLHLARSGCTPSDVAEISKSMFPYLQIADAPADAPKDFMGLLDEALHGRQCPGEGQLPITQLLEVIPDVPLSFEVRSRALRADYPDATERARHLLRFAQHL